MPLVIYFGGNSEDVSGMAYHFERFAGYSLLLINYRGYGLSEGQPTQRNPFHDAETISITSVKGKTLIPTALLRWDEVYVLGCRPFSRTCPLKGVILVSPYDALSV